MPLNDEDERGVGSSVGWELGWSNIAARFFFSMRAQANLGAAAAKFLEKAEIGREILASSRMRNSARPHLQQTGLASAAELSPDRRTRAQRCTRARPPRGRRWCVKKARKKKRGSSSLARAASSVGPCVCAFVFVCRRGRGCAFSYVLGVEDRSHPLQAYEALHRARNKKGGQSLFCICFVKVRCSSL